MPTLAVSMINLLGLMTFIAVAVLPAMAAADCIAPDPDRLKKAATRVFEGTVTKIVALDHSEYAATLTVHRVWKGKLARETTVHFRASLNGPDFEEGKRLVVFAQPLTAAAMRKDFVTPAGAVPREAFVFGCGGTMPPVEVVLKKLGRSREPSPP